MGVVAEQLHVKADVRASTQGWFGQRLLASIVQADFGIDGERGRSRHIRRELAIFDLAEQPRQNRKVKSGNTQVEWIRKPEDHLLEQLRKHDLALKDLKPRDPATARGLAKLGKMTLAQVRAKAVEVLDEEFSEVSYDEPERYDPREREAEHKKEHQDLLKAVETAPEILVRQLLALELAFQREGTLRRALYEFVSPLFEDDGDTRWSWAESLEEIAHHLEFEDRQLRVISDLLAIYRVSKTRPDYVVLEYAVGPPTNRHKPEWRVLKHAYIYESKTGGGKLTPAQEHAFSMAQESGLVDYRLVHFEPGIDVPKQVNVTRFNSGKETAPLEASAKPRKKKQTFSRVVL